MKILIVTITLCMSFLFANPTFAYTVQKGDTMTKIAKENNLSLHQLAEANPQIKDLDLIYVGQTVKTDVGLKEEIDSEYDIFVGKTINTDEPTVTPNQEELPPSSPEKQTATQEKKVNYSDSEIDLLARLVRAEAQGEPFDGKIAVACVVLNRIDSPKFPDTIKDVIYDHNQFQPVRNGEINKPADSDSIEAVKEALTTKRNLVSDSLFFYNPEIATSRWLDSRTTTVAIGQHVFKK